MTTANGATSNNQAMPWLWDLTSCQETTDRPHSLMPMVGSTYFCFLSLIFVGGHELPKSVANHGGRRAGQGGIGRQGKGEPQELVLDQ